MKEREISFVDLVVEIMLHWRMIIIYMIVGGLLMGALGYVRSMQFVAEQQSELIKVENEQVTLAGLEEILSEAQKNNVRAAVNYESFGAYCNQSLLMQLDATNLPRAELTFLVKTEDAEKSYNIERVYEEFLSAGLPQWLTDKGETEFAMEANELITVTQRWDQLSGNEYFGVTESTSFSVRVMSPDMVGNDSFTVQVLGVDEEQCRQISQYIVEYISGLQTEVSQQLGKHEITLLNHSFTYCVDREIQNRQRTIVANSVSDYANAEKLKKDFSSDEQLYYELLKDERENVDNVEENSTEQIVLNPSVSLKYILLGMFLFAFVCIFYLFLKYIFNNKLRATDDVKEIYDLSQLGLIPQKASRKRLLGFVDNWCLKLRDRNKRCFSAEEAIGLASVAVKMSVRKENCQEVFCIGCNIKGQSLKVAEQMQSMLEEQNIKLTILNNVLYDRETMDKLTSSKCVFLLETAGETFYEEINRELELLHRQEIRTLGVVVVE